MYALNAINHVLNVKVAGKRIAYYAIIIITHYKFRKIKYFVLNNVQSYITNNNK